MSENQKKFQQIIDSNIEFSQAKDLDLLVEKILRVAMRLSHADAGSLHLMEQGSLKFHHCQTHSPEQPGTSPQKHLIYNGNSKQCPPDSLSCYVAKTGTILNIASIDELDENAPYRIDPSVYSDLFTQLEAILTFPLKNNHGKVIGVVQVVNPRDETTGRLKPLTEDDAPLLQLFANNAANAIERAQNTRARVLGIIQILTALRDTEETVSHVNRVAAFAAEIYERWAEKKGLPSEAIASQKDLLRMAAMLHDLGKLAIPNVIRRKPARLNQEEYETMKEHTVKGAQLLLKYANSEIENVAAQIALTHHERWDGSGYPGHVDPNTGTPIPGHNEDGQNSHRGKKGEEIPAFGRAVAIADVYDSLANHRVFRKAWKEDDILQKLRAGSGSHFDPAMIDAFFECIETIHNIAEHYKDQPPAATQ